MTTSTIIFTTILAILLLFFPLRFFLVPYIITACLIPVDQRFFLFDLDFTSQRLLVLLGVLRLHLFNEVRIIYWNQFDKLIFAWVTIGSLIYIIQQGTLSAIIYKAGVCFDALLLYWLFRQRIQSWEDFSIVTKVFAILAVVSAPIVFLEELEGSSLFSIFGSTMGKFHRGRFRAAGPFPHYIIMGCFWASLLPFFYAQIKTKKNIFLHFIAMAATFSIVYSSASSTPIMTVIAFFIFWMIFNYRKYGIIIISSICFILLFLHLIMNKPVWHLMARVGVFGGSTGWHRYFLFDNFIKHISEWFILGTKSTIHWGHAQSDLTNQFVLEGVRGGIAPLLIFIAIVYLSIKIPGKLSLCKVPLETQWLCWGVCVAMLMHFVTFWGVSYFGQIEMVLFLTFSLVGFTQDQYENLHQ